MRAEGHLAIVGQLGVALGKFTLNLNGTVDRIYDAAKLRKDVVSRRIDDTSPILLGEVIDGGAVGFEGADGGLLIIPHQFAVTLDVRAENRRKLALKTLIGHGAPPMLRFQT